MKSSYEIRLSKSFSICATLACNELTVYISYDFNKDFH